MIPQNPFKSAPADGVTRLIFGRHAQTDANAKHYLQGQSDGVLNETGLAQAAYIAAQLRPFFVDKIYSSNQKRALATAAAIANEHDLPVETDPRLQEWNCGEWDAMPAVDFQRMIAEQGLTASTLEPPGGETFQQVRSRAEAALADIIAQSEGKSVLITSHGDFIRSMIGVLMGIEADVVTNFLLDNASYSILERQQGTWKILTLNCIS
ncbi:MAG: histidine phosphatase family protein [Anaerolineaceae bacterium]|nr:histidine phosphatase family protein [Anaerolineaceae bacterium]